MATNSMVAVGSSRRKDRMSGQYSYYTSGYYWSSNELFIRGRIDNRISPFQISNEPILIIERCAIARHERFSALACLETIADICHRCNMAWLAHDRLDFAAKAANIHGNKVAPADLGIAPDFVEDLVGRQRSPSVLHQVVEQPKLDRCQ